MVWRSTAAASSIVEPLKSGRDSSRTRGTARGTNPHGPSPRQELVTALVSFLEGRRHCPATRLRGKPFFPIDRRREAEPVPPTPLHRRRDSARCVPIRIGPQRRSVDANQRVRILHLYGHVGRAV